MNKFRERKPIRTETIKKYKHYSGYRSMLAKDFSYRCGYCNRLEKQSKSCFHIDHFIPQVPFGHLATEYTNLVYSCPTCNLAKSNKWISDSEDIAIDNNKGFIDPCDEKYDQIFYRDFSGGIKSNSELGEYIRIELKLYLNIHNVYWTIERILKLVKNPDFELLEPTKKFEIEKITRQILELILAEGIE